MFVQQLLRDVDCDLPSADLATGDQYTRVLLELGTGQLVPVTVQLLPLLPLLPTTGQVVPVQLRLTNGQVADVSLPLETLLQTTLPAATTTAVQSTSKVYY